MSFYNTIKNKIFSVIDCYKCGIKCAGKCRSVNCEHCGKQFYTINEKGILVCSMGCVFAHNKFGHTWD